MIYANYKVNTYCKITFYRFIYFICFRVVYIWSCYFIMYNEVSVIFVRDSLFIFLGKKSSGIPIEKVINHYNFIEKTCKKF